MCLQNTLVVQALGRRSCNGVQTGPSPSKEGFVMGPRTQGIMEILKIYRCPHTHKSELMDGTHGAGPLSIILHINS